MSEIKIKTLTWDEHIRTRPGMYVGDLDDISILVREVVDNSVDEALSGYCQNIYIDKIDKSIVVADDGRGMPIYLVTDPMNPTKKITAAESASSRINTGSKYEKDEANVGLNGVGTKAVNALSETYTIYSKVTKSNHDNSIPEVKNQVGKYYYVTYHKAKKVDEGCKELPYTLPFDAKTVVSFEPDMSIMRSDKYKLPVQNLGVTKHILKEFYKKDITYHIPNVTIDFDKVYNHTEIVKVPVSNSKHNKDLTFWFSFEFLPDKSKRDIFGSVNSLIVPRGIHVNEVDWGIRVGLQKMFNLDDSLMPYLTGGIKLSVVALINEISFSSQTKEKLSDIDGWDNDVKQVLHKSIAKSIRKYKDDLETHIDLVEKYVESLNQLKDLSLIKSKVQIANSNRAIAKLPWRLIDASSQDRDKCELFLLEGKSAAGNLRKARNSEFQAYLPMRGKSLNAVYYSTQDIVDNDILCDIINSIGAGVSGFSDISACRYGKIIIVTDSDVDGSHICALLLGFLAVHAPHLIEDGRVYKCETPLYEQGGRYFYPSESENPDFTKSLRRFKGIGELGSDDAIASITNPNTRRLTQITADDIDKAIEFAKSAEIKKQLMIDQGILRV